MKFEFELPFLASIKEMLSFESKDSKDHGTSINGSEGVANADNNHIFDAVSFGMVVTSKTDDGSEGNAE